MSVSHSGDWDLFCQTVEALVKPLVIEKPCTRISDASLLPAKTSGAYLLMINSERPITLNIRKFDGKILPAGFYTYAGSASGPGGLKARLARHLARSGKSKLRPHWHIDHLTGKASKVLALALPGARECNLHEIIIGQKAFMEPLSGFGASDCSHCFSHLAKWRLEE